MEITTGSGGFEFRAVEVRKLSKPTLQQMPTVSAPRGRRSAI